MYGSLVFGRIFEVEVRTVPLMSIVYTHHLV